jgi:hypothetical protein
VQTVSSNPYSLLSLGGHGPIRELCVYFKLRFLLDD